VQPAWLALIVAVTAMLVGVGTRAIGRRDIRAA
jgi:hypothetical protein